MQSPLFGNGRFASLGAGLRAVALTGHARNAVAAASIAAVGSVAYVRSWKEPPPKAPSDRWALTHERLLTSSSAQCILLELNMECLTSSHLALGELPGHACLLQPGRGGGGGASSSCVPLRGPCTACAAASCMPAAPSQHLPSHIAITATCAVTVA
jgi:hypothetical protein